MTDVSYTNGLNIVRVKFERGQEVKFISHLDLMKAFERAIRRSHIPVAYSQGFNPHPGMVFGLPLSVGVTSSSEYADFELADELPPEEFMRRLNDQLPRGLRIIQACRKTGTDNIMASIVRAAYDIRISPLNATAWEDIKNGISGLLDSQVIMVKKYTKSGLKDVDIRPMIHKLELEMPEIRAFLSAGSKANLKPELILSALKENMGLEFEVVNINRTSLLIEKGGRLTDPVEACG